MKKITSILSVSAFVFAAFAAVGGNMFLTSGWGKFTAGTLQKPINGGFNCTAVPTGIVCTVTNSTQTVTAYDTQANADAQTTTGILRRPQ